MTSSPPQKGPRLAALLTRGAALAILLYQIRLFAADMADTPLFTAALAGAFASAAFLHRKKIPPFHALIILALVPWVIRLFIALPRLFILGVSTHAILLDSLLLNFDINNFSALLPFYWAAITTYFSERSRVFLRADIIAADTFFLVLFSIAPASSIGAYRWPILMIAVFALVLFLQALSLVLSAPPDLKLRRGESIRAGAFLFLLVFLGGILFIRPLEEKAVDRGGGLLEPKLFRFDFSQVLRLESEISVSDDLVLIVKKDPEDYHDLLRRYTLSGYSPGQGFSRLKDVDEAAHPQSLPNRRAILPAPEMKQFRETEQEYYLVNFDATAFIGMNAPIEITPFETWDASSFNAAYAVKSRTSEALPYELIQAVSGEPGPESLKLSPEEYALYTDYGADKEIAAFARQMLEDEAAARLSAANMSGDDFPEADLSDGEKVPPPLYWEQAQIIYDRLKYGEYRYSQKPGIAPDGDQLKYFLFNSKKGYCSYYAFAYTLLLRSLGIPCRVAAGFFVDRSTGAFNYYPVRADMAHAWTEVWFPGYGWIDYDPTSETVAEGEEFRFSEGTPPELFERLMKEILDKRPELKPKEAGEDKDAEGSFEALGRETLKFFTRWGALIILASLGVLFLAIRSGFLWLSLLGGKPAKKTLYLWAHTKRRLALAGLGRSSATAFHSGEAEWAKRVDGIFTGLYSLYLENAAAKFAPVYDSRGCKEMAAHYRLFSGEYRKIVPARRRLLAWLLPPAALALPPPKPLGGNDRNGSAAGKSAGKRRPKPGSILLFIAILFLLRGESAAQDAGESADALYESAIAAGGAENWERAIELFGQGAELYPEDIRFPWSLGNLYYERRLYKLAWDELLRAERISPLEPDLLMQIANTAGYLNRNSVSALYLEKVLALRPDDKGAVDNLAWMYFKLHRLDEGERLLLGAIDSGGEDMDFAMTLGTIYSDMLKYDEAKDSYLKAVAEAEKAGDRLFAALSHYNLSILESRFYRFGLAFERTNASLEAMDRSSGRLARGELLLARMEIPQALAEYQDAYAMDNSPLSKLNLAQLFQIGGRLADAVLYAEDCLENGDESWMLNYGIDPVRYKRDIHEILADSYGGLYKAEKFSCPADLKEGIWSLLRRISYRFREAVHSRLFRKYSLLSAAAYGGTAAYGGGSIDGEIHPEALLQYYHAFEAYPRRAFAYLEAARDFEEPLIPESAPSYRLEEGSLLKDRGRLAEALQGFDPVWERDMIARTYAELAGRGSREEREDAAERLFAINPGALLQNGIKLPAEFKLEADTGGALRRILEKAAKSAGFEKTPGGGGAAGRSPRYTLSFGSGGEGYVSMELYDNVRGRVVFGEKLPLPAAGGGAQRAHFARALRDGVFNAF